MEEEFVNMKCFVICIVAISILTGQSVATQQEENVMISNNDRIQPYEANPRYWQYKGKPVLLLGGSETDHIFLLEGLKDHLDEMEDVGGNYVRNTMSQREPIELKAHKLLPDGKFDMDQWNEDYWNRFQNMLKWTQEREIFVQIEVWDRFDFSTDHWDISPWNPVNNINYTYEETGFAEKYPVHPARDKQPFFHSIKGMERYKKRYDLIREYQEKFVSNMLSYSLEYGHVLYCMDNETSTPAAWGQYWIQFIKDKAAEKGVQVYATDMFDDAFKAEKSEHTPIIFDNPGIYMFADISQNNSRNFNQEHWDKLQWLVEQISIHPRPINNTKIYGSGYTSFGSGGPEDGIERFWRNMIGGCASARFHRPTSGNGLNSLAKASLKAARKMESMIRMWDVTPQMHLLSDREDNEAYLAAKEGEQYAIYFPKGGSVGLDLSACKGDLRLKWISVSAGEWGDEIGIAGGDVVTISTPDDGGWAAAIVRE